MESWRFRVRLSVLTLLFGSWCFFVLLLCGIFVVRVAPDVQGKERKCKRNSSSNGSCGRVRVRVRGLGVAVWVFRREVGEVEDSWLVVFVLTLICPVRVMI